jgi:hypothetical protein
VPAGTLGYFRARNKQNVYGLVVKEFKKSGLSQADLARRLRKAPEVVCRLLGSPGNWTLDTVSDFLFAISAAEPKYDLIYPLDKAARNYVRQDQFAVSKGSTDGVASIRSTGGQFQAQRAT